jgi:hypothetical protein
MKGAAQYAVIPTKELNSDGNPKIIYIL